MKNRNGTAATKTLTDARNPLRTDPTRTGMLRNAMVVKVRQQFRKLRLAIIDLIVKHDALGLKEREPFTGNAYCATGPGGGQDNSCSPHGGGAITRTTEHIKMERRGGPGRRGDEPSGIFFSPRGESVGEYGDKVYHATILPNVAMHEGESSMAHAQENDLMDKPLPKDLQDKLGVKTLTEVEEKSINGGVHSAEFHDNYYDAYQRMAKLDLESKGYQGAHWTQEEDLAPEQYQIWDRNAMAITGADHKLNKEQGWYANNAALEVEDVRLVLHSSQLFTDWNGFVINDQWRFHSDPEKLKAFKSWLSKQMDNTVRGKNERDLWDAYVKQGFEKGAGRSFDDFMRNKPEAWKEDKVDFYQGSRQQFLKDTFARPESVEKVQLIASRTFDDLVNVTDRMATKMGRILADGLVQGMNPRDIGDNLSEELDIEQGHAETIARTEIIRAHAEGQLDAMDALGVEDVGVMVEWSTVGDERVCPECEPLEGVVLKIDEARGMIPRHPNCRCAWIPANVGEDEDDQTRGAASIKSAIRDSVEQGDDEDEDGGAWGPGTKISKDRPESILNRRSDVVANWAKRNGLPYATTANPVCHMPIPDLLENAFCATGQGGGQDNTCSPSGGSGSASKAEHTAARKFAMAKIKSAPVPSKEAVAKARVELQRAKEGEGRAGGDSRGGSAASRRIQRENLFKEFGGEKKGYVVCPWTGIKMHWTDDKDKNPNGYPKFERGKIFVKCQGGGYQLPNLIPESFTANRSRGDNRLRPENARGC